MREGSRIKLAGKGEAGLRGGPSGDLYVITHVTESPVFKPKGDHYEVEVPITVAEALGGAEVEVPTLNGTKKLRVAPGTKHGTVQRLRGEGPPVLSGSGRGDLHYRFVIDMPAELNAGAARSRRRALEGHERQPARADPASGRTVLMATRRTRITARVEHDRGVFMISVAAELAEMHPQTLRMYETRGLIEPKRSPKGTRLYSQADVERLRRIQEMTTEWGMNLAGVERVFELEEQLGPHAAQGLDPGAPRRAAPGGDRPARGGQARVGQGRDRALRGRARNRAHPRSVTSSASAGRALADTGAPQAGAPAVERATRRGRRPQRELQGGGEPVLGRVLDVVLGEADDDHAVRGGVERETAAGHRAGDLPGVAAGVAQVDG